jgi:hypothetical protein
VRRLQQPLPRRCWQPMLTLRLRLLLLRLLLLPLPT